jgi:YspA, cpYpsA-related SLOG family
MKVAISGSRTFTRRDVVERVIDRLIERQDFILVGDASTGVDRMVMEYCYHREDDLYDWQVYPADWKKYGKRAGAIRSEWMAHDADAMIVIFADGPWTDGTLIALGKAQAKGIPVAIYHEGRWEGSLGAGTGMGGDGGSGTPPGNSSQGRRGVPYTAPVAPALDLQ